MNKIYLIVINAEGSSGQGGECSKYISLMQDGDGYSRGTPYPAFESFETAENFRKRLDEWGFYHVIELPMYHESVKYSWSCELKMGVAEGY